jgi:deoxyhypusine synthase
MGEEALFRKHPAARGYLRPREGYRLFAKREELLAKLMKSVAKDRRRIEQESQYKLAVQSAGRPSGKAPVAKPARKRS